MGKNKQYTDDYTGDVKSIQKRHQKFKMLMTALCVSGVVAAGSATYVLMNPAQTMTKEGIDEMDPNDDFIVSDDDTLSADAFSDENLGSQSENYDDVPLIEEWVDDDNAPADAFPVDDPSDAENAALPGAMPGSIVTELEETETETEIAAAAEETTATVSELPAAETEAVAEIIGVSETEVSETLETSAPAAVETEAPQTEEVIAAAVETEEHETEVAVPEAEISTAETEKTVVETEIAETEEATTQTEVAEPEEPQSEKATEPAESETQAAEIREKSKDEVYVETEGEFLDEKWIDSVGLEIRDEDGWNKANTTKSGAIEVDADQTLRFRVTYTVQPGTLSPEMRTLIYRIPKEITSVEESYGEIVDANERILANYAIDEDGIIRVTFTEEIAELNEAGTKVTCKIEFRTKASNLAQ